MNEQVVRCGTWQRGERSGFVFITSRSTDYYWDEYSEGPPDVGPDGLAYYALYSSADDRAQASSRSPTCASAADAMERAERLVGPVSWR